eukprot:TRINITY_DN1553_c0_g2_i1.p1 TRINITY_DN1553_c0_g2~~TRINITY_DN1553_c0_g2_i1.p1  ORF type:complete len:157 (-),score=23.00 TRINITY_DN1553_c0_g2_i1:53-523(-)
MEASIKTHAFGPKYGDTKFYDDSIICKLKASDSPKVHKITVFTDGTFIFGIEIFYRLKNTLVSSGPHLGRDGRSARPESFELGSDEYITEIIGRNGAWFDHLSFLTSKGKIYSFGGQGGSEFRARAEAGNHISIFTVGVGGHLHCIQFSEIPIDSS